MAPPWPVLVYVWPLPELDAEADDPDGMPAEERGSPMKQENTGCWPTLVRCAKSLQGFQYMP